MGLNVNRSHFTPQDFSRFEERLQQNLAALRLLLARESFGDGPSTMGAELELYIVDEHARPLPLSTELRAAARDPRLTHEINLFNLEYNLSPLEAKANAFATMESEMRAALGEINRLALCHAARVIPIGILPRLRPGDFTTQNMTPVARYEALSRELLRIRGRSFAINIDGQEPLRLRRRDVLLEGATTSLQIHYRVKPSEYARLFNAVTLATPLVLAISCNSPFLFGKRLWQETRIPLFKLAADGRDRDSRALHLPPRVDFGRGWVREGAYELFAAAVHLYPPLLPLASRENALNRVRAGGVPKLGELRLHQGCTWPWNRPVYDAAAGGHLRIELRALPAGPSAPDMVANAAFALGLARGLETMIDELLPAMPFAIAAQNFYRAAQQGIQAQLLWPDARGTLIRANAAETALDLLPLAARGLRRMRISNRDASHYLGIIEKRIRRRTSGASWQLAQFERLARRMPRQRALRTMMEHYIENALAHLPVADWPEIE